ncbi:MAG TPA: flagellar motor protein MotB [Stellaceae bacterium]|nr:flagellar motor protein MotB [Stellaceae bacterium]
MIRSSGDSQRPKLGLIDGTPASGGQPGLFGLYGRPVSAGWMVTFADLLALLVSFFVLLFATTTVDPETWSRVVQSMRPYVGGTVLHPQGRPPAETAAPSPGRDLNYPEVLLRQLQDTHPGLVNMGIDRREHALVLHDLGNSAAKEPSNAP